MAMPAGRRPAIRTRAGWRGIAPAFAAVLLMLAPGLAAALDFVEIAPGHHLAAGAVEDWGPANLGFVSNSGLVVGRDCAAVIDTGGSPAAGRALLAAARRVTDRPVCVVILTHAHPDHVLGAAAFARAGPNGERPRYAGHARLAAALAARGPFYLRALHRDFGAAGEGAVLVEPTLPVDATTEIDLGGRRLQLQAWPTAHTDADLTVYDPDARVLWMGDLLFTDHLPVLDGRLVGWLDVSARLAAVPATMVVPGHGPVGRDWPAALAPQTRYLSALRDDVRRAIRSGASLAETVQQMSEPEAGWSLTATFHRRNVTAAYAELEWE